MKNSTIKLIIYSLSLVVFILVVLLNKRVIPAPTEFPSLIYSFPKINAFINGTCFLLLVLSGIAIKKGNIQRHKKLNVTTFGLSSLFLILYVTYHYLVPETSYGGENPLKSIYYFILITHIVSAAVAFPLILFSFQKGLNMEIPSHKKIVRWSYPIWLYVTFTGVLVYLMISPFYPWNN